MGCYTTWWKKTDTGGEPPPPPSKKVSFTGHRDIDESSFRGEVANTLSKIKAKYPDAIVNVGGAIGTDMVAGEEALKAGFDIVMVMPFAYDSEKGRWAHTTYWPQAQRDRLDYLVKNAQYVHIVNDTTKVTAKGYNVRNTALVDHGDVVLSRWDGRGHGGTFNCINQANGKGVPVFDAGTLKQIGIHHSRTKPSQDWQRLPDP
jgi:uncharacterized phage-like protein YoqJ